MGSYPRYPATINTWPRYPPPSRPSWGTPPHHPDLAGVPPTIQMWNGIPPQTWDGVALPHHPDLGWGTLPCPDLWWSTPLPIEVWTDKQTENSTFPHPSDVGSKKSISLFTEILPLYNIHTKLAFLTLWYYLNKLDIVISDPSVLIQCTLVKFTFLSEYIWLVAIPIHFWSYICVTVRSRMFTVFLQTNGFRRCAGLFSSIVTLKCGLSHWLPSSGGPCRVY